MNILHLSTHDITGGAARSAYRLHQGLGRRGHQSRMLVSTKASHDPYVVTVDLPADLLSRVRRRLRRKRIERDFARYRPSRPAGLEAFSDDRTPGEAALVRLLPECDVINLHWVAGLLDHPSFFSSVPRVRPIVWTLHDMNALTGGCHYDLGCRRHATQCGACPQLGSPDPGDLASQVWQRKSEALSGVPPRALHIVAPSRWLARTAKQSALLARFPVTVIPYGIDLEVFAPRDRRAAREVLGIPQAARVVLFLADVLSNGRKGFDLLMRALQGCVHKVDHLALMSLGHNPPPNELPVPWFHFGFLADDRLLSLMYSAADVFVIPSRQDNLPNTVLEALACGLPCIGFDVGGISDMVRAGVTGLLAPSNDVDGLERATVELLGDEARRRTMARTCRAVCLAEYALDRQAQRYAELYAGCLAAFRAPDPAPAASLRAACRAGRTPAPVGSALP